MTRNSLAIVLWAAILAMYAGRPWIDPALALFALFLLACCWSIALTFGRASLHWSFPMVPLASAVAWAIAGPSNATLAVLIWAGNLVAFCLASQVGRPLLGPLLGFASVLTVVSVLHPWGPFVNRDHYAAFIELVLPLALVEAFAGSLRFAVISAAMYASVIACASRAGAVLTTVEIAIVWMAAKPGFPRFSGGAMVGAPGSAAAPRTGRRTNTSTLSFSALAAVFVLVAGWAPLWHRLQDPDPIGGRSAILASTLAMVRARPWTGFGLGAFRTVYPAYASLDFGSVVEHAHNDWAEWAADGGIPFSLMLLSIAVWTVRKLRRAPWAVGALAVFVHALVDYPLHRPALELWLFALLGVLAAGPAANPD
ncbi:MAG TPA: O-antigen ligase family protein [Bryobacteraceae bacterium]|nr:O-antigen ligase family protein [Bryobacteraceae bacterium]